MTNEPKFYNMQAGPFEQILREWEDRMRAEWEEMKAGERERALEREKAQREAWQGVLVNPLVEEWTYADAEGRAQQRREQEGLEAFRAGRSYESRSLHCILRAQGVEKLDDDREVGE